MFDEITISIVFTYLLAFCRIGSAIMMLPGISLPYITPRSRLFLAVGVTVVVAPIVKPMIPVIPQSAISLILLLTAEVIIGVMIGSVAKIILSSIHVAGQIISYIMGLAAASMFDPSQGEQGTQIGTFLNIMAIAMIFATGMHHIFLEGIVSSYKIFEINGALPIGGFSDVITRVVSESFMMGVKISSPQIVVGLLLSLGAGVMGRLMPQMQVFFILMPVQIILGFFIIMTTLSATMMIFMNHYQEVMSNFMQ